MGTAAAVAAAAVLLVLPLLGHQVRCCDIFQGRWVYDATYPIYNSTDCPFLEQEFNCQHNGRPDKLYLKYRWKPAACNLPRFRAGDFLWRFRGKRIMFVGDSLSLNQWQSLTCMLHKVSPQVKYTLFRKQGISTFRFPVYNISILLSRNAFLVDLVSDKIGRVLKLDSIQNGKTWKGFDTLIFNTWHWWLHTGRQQPWDFIQYAKTTYKDMDRLVAYEKGLTTWARWIDSNIDSTKTKVIFQGVSPDHMRGSNWGEPKSKNCQGQAQPLLGLQYEGRTHPAQAVVEKVLRKMSKKVYLLNVTNLSQLRKDGHPSIYGFGGRLGMDCSHWCLPGVPDIWNQLLYATLIQK